MYLENVVTKSHFIHIFKSCNGGGGITLMTPSEKKRKKKKTIPCHCNFTLYLTSKVHKYLKIKIINSLTLT